MPLLILVAVVLLVGALMRRGPGPGHEPGQGHHHGMRFWPLAALLLLAIPVMGFFGRMGGRGGVGGRGFMGGSGYMGGRGFIGGPGSMGGFGLDAARGFHMVPTTTWEWVFLGVRVAVMVGLLVAGFVLLKRQGFFERAEVRHLRQRLANGEITPEEYDRLLPKLKD